MKSQQIITFYIILQNVSKMIIFKMNGLLSQNSPNILVPALHFFDLQTSKYPQFHSPNKSPIQDHKTLFLPVLSLPSSIPDSHKECNPLSISFLHNWIDIQLMNPQEGDSGGCSKPFSKDICYQLSFMDLKPPKMYPQLRQSVFRWMMEQVAAHKLSRKIYGLACYYFDLYLQKLKEKENDPLQAIAMVCLILASKLDNRTFLKFTCPQIPLASIFELELRVIIKLNYRLNPETYMQILDELMHEWDAFTLTHQPQLQGTRFLSGGLQGVNRAIRMFQLMDCVNLVINSLEYSYIQLSFNLFYLEIYRELYGVVDAQWEGQGGIDFGRMVYRDEKEYVDIFWRFMGRERVEEMMAYLDVEVGIYLLPFMRMKNRLKTKEDQQQSVHLQCVNQSALEVSSMIIQRQLIHHQ